MPVLSCQYSQVLISLCVCVYVWVCWSSSTVVLVLHTSVYLMKKTVGPNLSCLGNTVMYLQALEPRVVVPHDVMTSLPDSPEEDLMAAASLSSCCFPCFVSCGESHLKGLSSSGIQVGASTREGMGEKLPMPTPLPHLGEPTSNIISREMVVVVVVTALLLLLFCHL